MGTAQAQGELWGARAQDWAQLQEPAWEPVFRKALLHAGVRAGLKLLDVGCGAGGVLVMARELGAESAGLDGAVNLIAIARARLPGACVVVGDMDELPFADRSFDVVTGINAFQFAGNLLRALAEARRVCRPGGMVFVLTWSRREDCQFMTITMPAVLALLPPPAPGSAPPSPPRERPIEEALQETGFEPIESGEFSENLVFADASRAVRAVMSAGVTVKAAHFAGPAAVSDAIRRTLPAVTQKDGSIVWRNAFRWVRAKAP
ncbi:MAG TPA: class I SAM-dependent methyltransferase [Burkholderiaceae bacterium]|nr:class I SAM-dependent methyltransferase [Burkholderiaceae bacterium]